jgi:hypothetical protein
MPRHTEDVANAPDWGQVLPEGWYHVRIKKVEEATSETGNPICNLTMAVQNEPFVGRPMFDPVSLQAHALSKIKAYFKATGLMPRIQQEGSWDTDWLLDTELYVQCVHEVYKGETRGKIPPWGIKALTEQVSLNTKVA